MDAYVIGHKILELYSANVDKSSGEINKNSMVMPIYAQVDDSLIRIHSVTYEKDVGVVLTIVTPKM